MELFLCILLCLLEYNDLEIFLTYMYMRNTGFLQLITNKNITQDEEQESGKNLLWWSQDLGSSSAASVHQLSDSEQAS